MKDEFMKEYNNILDVYYAVEEDNENRQQDLKDQLRNDRISDTVYQEQIKELKDNLFNKRTQTQRDITELGNRLKGSVKSNTKPKADDINDDLVKLLKSGINWSQEELNEMIQEQEGNSTMTRIISDYSKERDILVRAKDPNTDLYNIDQLIDTTNKAIGGLYLTTVMKDTDHRNDFVKGIIETI